MEPYYNANIQQINWEQILKTMSWLIIHRIYKPVQVVIDADAYGDSDADVDFKWKSWAVICVKNIPIKRFQVHVFQI